MNLLNIFRKPHAIKDPPALLNVSEFEKNPINYMNYFFKERNQDLLSEPIHNRLVSLSNEELVSLAVDVLSVTFNFLRHTAEVFNPDSLSERERFYRAMIWHLSDAVHNLPTHLDVVYADNLIDYLTEYFVFVECLERLEDRPEFGYRYGFLFSFRSDIRKSLPVK